ncbi:hypothetical protein KCMC57_up24290 [Kitasatospora sp. CMC57]|uniref:non-specific serine/threonine protein kinase n=1 Tax=Kitasatospora sp. CMC57 TaxID=3231513 RepID=A0AB33JS29_9ACTN
MRAGDVLDGKYELIAEIGRGGFGVVWRAVDTRLGREIAVKVISDSAELGAGDLARFRHEARAVAKLNHPHIVTLHDLGETVTGSPYLVMELVQGRSLAAVVKRSRPGLPQVLDWLGQVCVALAAAHRAEVVHRDIKPENIMITDSGSAKVLDFGIARLDGRPGGLTTVGTVIGSPVYLAPERWADGPVDGRVDLYAVGCMLYELCVGQRPFNAGTVVGLMRQHVDLDPPRPRQLAPELPLPLERLILDLMAKNPADRPADGLEVARRLAEIRPGRVAELRARADAVWALGAAGSPAEAARRLPPLIGAFARECGPDDPRTLRTCHDLALWLAADGRVPEAVGLLGELLATGLDGQQAEDAARDLARLTVRLPPRAAPVTGQLAPLVG